MDRARQSANYIAAICNAAWWVRWYCRPHQVAKRAAAVRALGLTVREAFNAERADFEPLLEAIARTFPKSE